MRILAIGDVIGATGRTYLKDNLQSGDILLTIGAGNVYKIGEELIEG